MPDSRLLVLALFAASSARVAASSARSLYSAKVFCMRSVSFLPLLDERPLLRRRGAKRVALLPSLSRRLLARLFPPRVALARVPPRLHHQDRPRVVRRVHHRRELLLALLRGEVFLLPLVPRVRDARLLLLGARRVQRFGLFSALERRFFELRSERLELLEVLLLLPPRLPPRLPSVKTQPLLTLRVEREALETLRREPLGHRARVRRLLLRARLLVRLGVFPRLRLGLRDVRRARGF